MLSKFGLTPYEDPTVEAAFQRRYFQHGRNSVLVFCFLVFFLASSTLLRDLFLDNPDKFVAQKQVLRAVMCFVAVGIFAILYNSTDLRAAYFKLIQLVLAGFVTAGCFFVVYFLAEPYTDEAYARQNSTISITIIAICTLLRLPLKILLGIIALLFFAMAQASWGFFQSSPRVWIQGQIYLICCFMLGFLSHATNRWNERRLFDIQLKLDQQLAVEAQNSLKKTKFISALSHDLKQPLTGLVGYLELAENKISKNTNPEIVQFIQKAQNSATTISKNLTRVLELARIQDIAFGINQRSVDLYEITDLIGRLYEAQVTAQNITLKIINPATKIYGHTDFDLLFQILQNLVSNSVKYRRMHPIKSKIILSSAQLGNRTVKISIVDNGRGIQSSEIEKIFEPYHQALQPAHGDDKGLGLGLAFVQEAISRLPHHRLKVWSNGSSITKVNIWLPAAQPVQDDQKIINLAQQGKQKTKKPDLNSLHILLIEDQESIREFVREALIHEVASITQLTNFSDLDQLKSNNQPINFIVSDFNLTPSLNGVDLAEKIQIKFGRPIPTLIISGQSKRPIATFNPLIGYLPKPFNVSELLFAIDDLGK
jgi:signal transduction histidine kinase